MTRLTDCYDINGRRFKDKFAKEQLLKYLYDCIPDIWKQINKMFKKEPNHLLKESEIINIVLDPVTVKQSLYSIDLDDLICEFEKEEYHSCAVKGFVQEYRARKEMGEIFRDEWIESRLLSIKYTLENTADENSHDYDLVLLINQCLYRETIAGEFYESENYPRLWAQKNGNGWQQEYKGPTIVLYLNVIGRNQWPNDFLIEVFVHELFHAYHWMNAGRSLSSSNMDENAVKEGLASFVEAEYTEKYLNNYALADRLIKKLESCSMRWYPYSAYCYLKDYPMYLEVFEKSLINLQDAYAHLIKQDREVELIFD